VGSSRLGSPFQSSGLAVYHEGEETAWPQLARCMSMIPRAVDSLGDYTAACILARLPLGRPAALHPQLPVSLCAAPRHLSPVSDRSS